MSARIEARRLSGEHRWADVNGWGGAAPGTKQCDECYRVASPGDPKVRELLDSECFGRPPGPTDLVTITGRDKTTGTDCG